MDFFDVIPIFFMVAFAVIFTFLILNYEAPIYDIVVDGETFRGVKYELENNSITIIYPENKEKIIINYQSVEINEVTKK